MLQALVDLAAATMVGRAATLLQLQAATDIAASRARAALALLRPPEPPRAGTRMHE